MIHATVVILQSGTTSPTLEDQFNNQIIFDCKKLDHFSNIEKTIFTFEKTV